MKPTSVGKDTRHKLEQPRKKFAYVSNHWGPLLYDIDQTVIEVPSGKDIHRPELQQLLNQLSIGDVLVVHFIDRLCRNMMDMCDLTLKPHQQGISLMFIEENIHFSASEVNPLQELQLHMMSVFGQFERSLIRERQAEGIAD